jgi:hypothetical protein
MMVRYSVLAFAFLGVLLITASSPAAEPAGWGTIKGQVAWAGDGIPKPATLKVDKDPQQCLAKGPLFSDTLVVNPKNKGVRWVVVYLVDAKDPKAALPVHPALKALKKLVVEVDQPCCMFEPHIVALREGQTLDVKNSAAIAHNVKVDGGVANPNLNQIIPPGGALPIPGWTAAAIPVPIACNIHSWMHGWVAVFKHPYHAITDADGNFEIKNAPAGTYHLVTWHESVGWVKGGRKGFPIEIKADGTNNLGKIPLQPSKD